MMGSAEMTTPYERTLALKRTREVLAEISNGSVEPMAMQRRVAAILRHYPSDIDLSIASAEAPAIFSEEIFASHDKFEKVDLLSSEVDETYWMTKVKTGELIPEEALRTRLRVTPTRFTHVLRKTGSIFSIRVNETDYFPSIFEPGRYRRERRYRICRIIYPAPARERFLFLTSCQTNLDGYRPIDFLADEKRYDHLLRVAKGWSDGWYQTSLRVYRGMHSLEPSRETAVFAAVMGGDPHDSLWEKCVASIGKPRLEEGDILNTQCESATVFVWQETKNFAPPEMQAKLYIDVQGDQAHVRTEEIDYRTLSVSLAGTRGTQTVLQTIFAAFIEASQRGN
jgi:hypothetical protein